MCVRGGAVRDNTRISECWWQLSTRVNIHAIRELRKLQEQNEGTNSPGKKAEYLWIDASRLVELTAKAVEILSWWPLLVK